MKTEIICINDRSGSMTPLQDATIEGFNGFIEAQKEVPGECRVTYVQFDYVAETLYQGMPIKNVKPLNRDTYMPRGSTALFDAIGETLEQQGKRIANEGWADLVIVQISTDGEENASKKFTLERIREMIEWAERHGWKFIFTAANQDGFKAAQTYGIRSVAGQSFAANASGKLAEYATVSASITNFRTAQP